jgi:LPXTG-site transpeptidase (sortase) family protein
VQVIIPSIGLDTPIVNVGINEKGEMAVPDGKTKNVGWYEKGTIPGETGSAVLAAHVYAAFKKLRYAKIGDPVYVRTQSGKILHFRIEDSRVFKLNDISTDWLFNQADKKRLNLITCAGKYIPKLATYEKRLIVNAVLVDE